MSDLLDDFQKGEAADEQALQAINQQYQRSSSTWSLVLFCIFSLIVLLLSLQLLSQLKTQDLVVLLVFGLALGLGIGGAYACVQIKTGIAEENPAKVSDWNVRLWRFTGLLAILLTVLTALLSGFTLLLIQII